MQSSFVVAFALPKHNFLYLFYVPSSFRKNTVYIQHISGTAAMYAAIKTNPINEMDLRLNYNCPSINEFVVLIHNRMGTALLSNYLLMGLAFTANDNCSL